MSWHGPSAPRVEGIATKSLVVASWASKPASTASRILRCISTVIRRLQLGIWGSRECAPYSVFERSGYRSVQRKRVKIKRYSPRSDHSERRLYSDLSRRDIAEN